MTGDVRRSIPSVSSLLEHPGVVRLLAAHPRSLVVDAVRRTVEAARRDPMAAGTEWAARIEANLNDLERRSLRPVINATGVILHTNLGRAPLADAAVAAIQEVATGYTNLEYDIAEGQRGSRYAHCVNLLRELTGGEDAIVVNNCAAGLVLALSSMARGREVIISRGELVEIGGSFRVPDIMARSGAELREVGTTNRTHLDDYVRAISAKTGAIAKVHRSNFAQSGFVADVSVDALAPVASEHGIPIMHDLGSGLLIDLSAYGLTGEPTAREALGEGATIVLMSGDKLLGGPQAGIVVGAKHAITRMRQDPLVRALRVDKLTIAALTATLELYREPQRAIREIPVLAMITAPLDQLRERADKISASLAERGVPSHVAASTASIGAGAFPIYGIPSISVVLEGNAHRLHHSLRNAGMAVIGRITDDRLHLDLRSTPERFDAGLIESVARSVA